LNSKALDNIALKIQDIRQEEEKDENENNLFNEFNVLNIFYDNEENFNKDKNILITSINAVLDDDKL
jgi:hypothetical protein